MQTQLDAPNSPATAGVEVIKNIETLIKSHIASIERLTVELKEQMDMLNDLLKKDSLYAKHSEEAKEKAKQKQTTKAQILKRSDAYSLADKIRNTRSEKKNFENALSDYLTEYQRLSGQNTIEDESGNVQEIVYTAKLKKRSQYHP